MYELPKLPYPYDALEPYIDAKTMEIHHSKHHQAYINKLNEALDKYPELKDYKLDELLMSIDTIPQDIRTTIRNNAGGHYNHTLFWQMMSPDRGGEPDGKVQDMITKQYGNFMTFKERFSQEAMNVFGSGWAWLVKSQNTIQIISTPNQNSPIMDGYSPILGVDVWEHAYYLKYQNKRNEYIDHWWNVVNWNYVNSIASE